MSAERHSIVLANLGAPGHLSEVRPFLKNLFQDPDIFHFPFGRLGQGLFASMLASIRAPKSRKYYAAIGGGSPLHANTVVQAKKLQAELDPLGNYRVYVAQRYWYPFIGDIADQIRREGCDRLQLIPLFPHYSTTTTLSIINEWDRVSQDLPKAEIVPRFYKDPEFIEASVLEIQSKMDEFNTKPHILFSAHSIPESRVKNGDPYESEITDHMERIIKRLGGEYSYSLCYQSKVGPIKWLGPTVEVEIDRLVSKGIIHLLVYPISFVSEHVETLYELDIQKRDYALEHGVVQYVRAGTVQDRSEFIQVLKKLVIGNRA